MQPGNEDVIILGPSFAPADKDTGFDYTVHGKRGGGGGGTIDTVSLVKSCVKGFNASGSMGH